MANKTGKNRQKRISYIGKARINKKESVWAFKTRPGAHAKNMSATFANVIRDILKLAQNTREVKYILNNKNCLVNGSRVKDYKFSIGLFDIIEFKDVDKVYRVIFNSHDKIELLELSKEDKLIRPCRITKKKIIGKDKIQVGFGNGFNWILPKGKNVKLGDTVIYDVSKKEFTDILEMKENVKTYIFGGPHVSKMGTLKNIVKGDLRKSSEITIESKGKDLKTMEKYVFAIPNDFLN